MSQLYRWEQIIDMVGLEPIMQSQADLEDKLQFFCREWTEDRHLIWRMFARDSGVYELDMGYLGQIGQCNGYKDDDVIIEPHKFIIESQGFNNDYCNDCRKMLEQRDDGLGLS